MTGKDAKATGHMKWAGHSPPSIPRNVLRAVLLATFVLLLGATGLAQGDDFDWDQEFPYPVYLSHITMTGTPSGPQERDFYILYPAPPDEDGILLVSDGYGGFYINEATLVGGAFTTPRAVCDSVRGTPAENFDTSHVPQLPSFRCAQQMSAEECDAKCKEYNNPNSSGTVIDGKCSCTCNPGYEPDENLNCVPTKAKCDQDCREYHGTSKIHGPEAYGKVENGICNCYCNDGYEPDDTLTCVKVEKKGEEKKKPYCGDDTCDARRKLEDDRLILENCQECPPDCDCVMGTSCNPSHPDATLDNWGCVKVVAVIIDINSRGSEKPEVWVSRSGTGEYAPVPVGTKLNRGDHVDLRGHHISYPWVTIDWGDSQGRLILGEDATRHAFFVEDNALKTGWPTEIEEFRERNRGAIWEIISNIPKVTAGPVISFLGNPSGFPKDVIKVNVKHTHIVIEQGFEDLSVYALEGEAVVDDGQRTVSATGGMKVSVVAGVAEEPIAFSAEEFNNAFPVEPMTVGSSGLSTTWKLIILAVALALLFTVCGLFVLLWVIRRRRPSPAVGPAVGAPVGRRPPPVGTPMRQGPPQMGVPMQYRPPPAAAPIGQRPSPTGAPMGAPVGQVPAPWPAGPRAAAWGTLSVARGQATPPTLNLEKPVITIGRDPNNDLVLQDSLVSRRHAQIQRTDGGAVITDLNSVNGTLLNRMLVTRPSSLRSGDVIRLGDTELLFQ